MAAAFADATGEPVTDPAALAAGLDQAWSAVQRRWPSLPLSAASWATYLGARVDDAGLSGLHTEDLALACACAEGSSEAIGILERDLLATVPAMVSRLRLSESLADELQQTLRARLLVGAGTRPPAITKYAGRGSLAGWLKVVAMREGMALIARDSPRALDDEVELLSSAGHDAEFDHMRNVYGAAFRDAFRYALQSLDSRDRRVLRAHLIERLSIDALAKIHDVHRATAARWLVSIRAQLRDATRAKLMEQLGVDIDELESILRMVGSQIDATFGAGLQSDP